MAPERGHESGEYLFTVQGPQPSSRLFAKGKVRATDAKEVGVENPAEETFRCPNQLNVTPTTRPVKG